MAKRSQQKTTDSIYELGDGDYLDKVCPLCERGSDPTNNDHACRVCGRVFHKACCERDGRYSEFDISAMDRAFTKIGWSCLDCDDIAMSALSSDEHMQISDIFQKYDTDGDESIKLAEYLSVCEDIMQQKSNRKLTHAEIEEEEDNFRKLDRDESGEIDFKEFIAHEAVRYISEYEKEDLVRLLTPLEKKSAKKMFNLLDKNGDGEIDMIEAVPRYGLLGWYSLLQRAEMGTTGVPDPTPTVTPTGQRRRSSVVGQHIVPQALNVRKCDENRDGRVSWPEFLRGHALEIIISRPNKSNQDVSQ